MSVEQFRRNSKPTFQCKGHQVSRNIAGLWHPLTFKNNQFTIQTKTQNVSYFTHVMPNSSHFTSKSLLGILEKQATASEHYHISLKTPLQRNVYMKTSHLRPATGVDFVEHDELSILVHRSNSESKWTSTSSPFPDHQVCSGTLSGVIVGILQGKH